MTDAARTELDMLDGVLDVYGADRTRWPAAARREISALLTISEEARSRLADAEAFDRLLDLAPAPGAERVSALSERIMASSRSTPRVAATAPVSRPNIAPRIAPIFRRHAGGFAALAASLMIGILAGQSASVQPALTAIAALAGFDEAVQTNVSRADDADDSLDGELL